MTSWQSGKNRDARSTLDDLDVNPIGAGLVLAGAVLILAAFTVVDWYRSGPGFFANAGSATTFGDIHNTLRVFDAKVHRAGIANYYSYAGAKTYFGWLGWVLFVAALVSGAFAVSRFGRDHWSLRWLSAVICAGGLAATLQAIDLISVQGNPPLNARTPTFGDYFGHTALGAWAAIAGFALMLVGSLIPHRNR